MSLPRSMGADDSAQVRSAGAAILPTPALVEDIIPSAQELSRLALDPKRVWEAYRSFLLAPVPQLLDRVCLTIQKFADAIAVDCMPIWESSRPPVGVPYVGVCRAQDLEGWTVSARLHERPECSFTACGTFQRPVWHPNFAY